MQQRSADTIRTKVANLDAEFDDRFFALLERLRSREIDTETFQRRMLDVCGEPRLHRSLHDAMARVDRSNEAEWLVRRHVGSCRYTVQVYKLQPRASQAPHEHHNLISTHVVLRGQVHLRQYDRIATDGANNLVLQPVRDAILDTGGIFQASEWSNNVHWFGAVGSPALMFSVDARGYETSTFHSDNDQGEPFGRRYVDPTEVDASGRSIGVGLAEAAAKNRFEGRPVSDFPMPRQPSNDQIRQRKSA